jgi:hypothetical protein
VQLSLCVATIRLTVISSVSAGLRAVLGHVQAPAARVMRPDGSSCNAGLIDLDDRDVTIHVLVNRE